MQERVADEPHVQRSGRRLAITVAIIVVAIALMIINSPQRFDMDLGKIGAGQPALVLIYDDNLVVSTEQAQELNVMRKDFDSDIVFLVADVDVPQAQELMNTHSAGPAAMLLFAADGRLLKKMQGLLTAEQLRAELTGVTGS